MKPYLLLVLFLALLPSIAALSEDSFTYLGSISYPNTYVPHGLDHNEYCADPSPNDGFPGCLVATSPKKQSLQGMMDIPSSGSANTVYGLFDCSFGIREQYINFTKLSPDHDYRPREIADILFLSEDTGICTCVHDWYNTARDDHVSHCWFNTNTQTSSGPYQDLNSHAMEFGEWIFEVPQWFADQHLTNDRWCASGMKRDGAGQTPRGSAGPTMVFFPCDDPTNSNISGIKVIDYEHEKPTRVPGNNDLPAFSVKSGCEDAVWVEDTVIVSCRQGSNWWWYGEKNVDAVTEGKKIHRGGNHYNDSAQFNLYGAPIPITMRDECAAGKGFHAPNEDGTYNISLYFYNVSDIARSLKGELQPHEVIPYFYWKPDEWTDACGEPGGIAYDDDNDILYVAQRRGDKLIHRYKVNASQSSSSVAAGINAAPVIVDVFPQSLTRMNKTMNRQFRVNASDSDHDALTYYWYVNGSVNGTGPTFSLDARSMPKGNWNVTVLISDGHDSVSHAWTFKIRMPKKQDITDDDVVDVKDLRIIAKHVIKKRSYRASYDQNNDGIVNIFDLISVIREFGKY